MKILIVSDHMIFPNGYTRRRDQWLRLLANAGHEVRSWRPGPGGNGTGLPSWISSRILHGNEGIPGIPDLELWRLMKWADVIHLMAGGPASLFALCTGWAILGKRVVTSVHVSKDFTERLNPLLRASIKFILHPLLRFMPHAVLFPTEHNRISWEIPEDKGLVFGTTPYMLELPEPTNEQVVEMRRRLLSLPSRAESKQNSSKNNNNNNNNNSDSSNGNLRQRKNANNEDENDVDLNKPIVAFIGRLVWTEKRLDRVVRLAEALGDRARVVVVGNGPERARFEAAAPSVGMAGSMPYEDMRIVYAAIDASISPGDVESFGMVPIESLLCGRAGYVQDNHRFRQVYGVAGDDLFVDLDKNVAADSEKMLQQMIAHRKNLKSSSQHWFEMSQRIVVTERDVIRVLHKAYGIEN